MLSKETFHLKTDFKGLNQTEVLVLRKKKKKQDRQPGASSDKVEFRCKCYQHGIIFNNQMLSQMAMQSIFNHFCDFNVI